MSLKPNFFLLLLIKGETKMGDSTEPIFFEDIRSILNKKILEKRRRELNDKEDAIQDLSKMDPEDRQKKYIEYLSLIHI